MKRIWLPIAIAAGIFIASCSKDENQGPAINIPTIDFKIPAGGFSANNLQWVRINPTVGGGGDPTFLWTLGNDTISTTQNLLFVSDTAGSFNFTFTVKNAAGIVAKQVPVTISASPSKYKNAVTKVLEYLPAPGQFVNDLPVWKIGYTADKMNQQALDALTTDGLVHLGGFGGYVIMGFDHAIVNKPGQYSFLIEGNAFANNAEPGVIEVSVDTNGNGIADDEWYEIAGSEYNNPKTIKNYEITYYKPNENKVKTPSVTNEYLNDTTYIKYKDNQGNTGYLTRNIFHGQSYYPQWKGDSITFKGTRLPDDQIRNISEDPDNPYYYILPAFPWGYVDNQANDADEAKIKLDWAVDKKTGKPVKLKAIDFIKVYTGIRKEAGWLGEVSTEVGAVTDFNLVK